MASTRAKFYILFTLILLLELFVFNIASPLLAWSSISPSSSSSNSRPRLPELELALDGFIPPLKPAEGHEWISQSRSTVRRVVRCLAEGLGGESGCREEELKVVIALQSVPPSSSFFLVFSQLIIIPSQLRLQGDGRAGEGLSRRDRFCRRSCELDSRLVFLSFFFPLDLELIRCV